MALLSAVFTCATFAVVAAIAYMVYVTIREVMNETGRVVRRKTGIELVSGEDGAGLKVNLKNNSYESYLDSTQKVLYSIWDNSETLGYKAKWWAPKTYSSDGEKGRSPKRV